MGCFEMVLLHQFSNSVGFFWATSEEFHRLLRYLPNVQSFKHGSHAFVIVSGRYLKVFFFLVSTQGQLCLCVCFLLIWQVFFYCLMLSLKGLL